MISLLISIVIICLVAGFAVWAIRQMPFIAEPYKTIAIGAILLILVIWLLLILLRMAPPLLPAVG